MGSKIVSESHRRSPPNFLHGIALFLVVHLRCSLARKNKSTLDACSHLFPGTIMFLDQLNVVEERLAKG